MRFHIEHTTEYDYPDPASESFSELRLRPRDSLRQKVTRHQTLIEPGVLVESHIDYFGNYVETISIPYRHQRLVISSACEVETKPFNDALAALDLTIAEARQMYQERRRELHDFLRPSQYVRLVDPVREMASELLPEAAPLPSRCCGSMTISTGPCATVPGPLMRARLSNSSSSGARGSAKILPT